MSLIPIKICIIVVIQERNIIVFSLCVRKEYN